MPKTPRLHGLDALRAIMMLLGIVLHAALTYNVTEHGEAWGLSQDDNHVATDFLVLLIHTFRMPVFFLIAGFFGALLFHERGRWPMVRNRVARIVYPFLVALLLLWPLIYFAFGYSQRVFAGHSTPVTDVLSQVDGIGFFVPSGTSHLWFLYYLTLITAVTVLLALVALRMPALTRPFQRVLSWLWRRPLARFLVFTVLTAGLLKMLGTSMVGASTSLSPDLATFAYFGWFYVVGWTLYHERQQLPSLPQRAWGLTVAGLLLVILQGVLIQYSNLGLRPGGDDWLQIGLASLTVWLFIFGLTGLFLRYGAHYSPLMRYVSDASYWVYLIHLPIVVVIPALIDAWPLPALLKFAFVVAAASVVCFLTYHYWVRAGFIGRFLNGRRYARGLPQRPDDG